MRGTGPAPQRTPELVRVEAPIPVVWMLYGQLEYEPPVTPMADFRLTLLAGIGSQNMTLRWRIPFFQDPTRFLYPITTLGESLDLAPGASVVTGGVQQGVPAEILSAFCEFSCDTGGDWGPVRISLGCAPLTPIDPEFYAAK
jgi:hypothetical protein